MAVGDKVKGADALNPPPSKKKEKSAGTSETARVDFLMRVMRKLHVRTFGEHETAAVFDNDKHKETTAASVEPPPETAGNI